MRLSIEDFDYSFLNVVPLCFLASCGGDSTTVEPVTTQVVPSVVASPAPITNIAQPNKIFLGGAISANSTYNFDISSNNSALPWWVQNDVGTTYILQNMKDAGMNTVTLHFNYSLDPKTDTFFRPQFETNDMYLNTPDWKTIEAGAIRASSMGIKPVFYMTIIQLPNSWDSLLATKYVPNNPDAFFASYKEHILKIAELSEKYDSPYMSIGVELGPVATDAKYLPYWKDIIQSVRKVYDGKLSYSSYVDDTNNYYTELNFITFKNDIDLLGMNVFPQTLDEGQLNGTYKEFYDEWKTVIVPNLSNVITSLDKPVFISEFGINRLDGTGSKGYWGNDNGMKLDFQEQADLFDAALQAIHEGLAVKGIVFWGAADNVDLVDGTIDVTKSYTNNWIDVPAESIIAKWMYQFTNTYSFG